MPPKSLWPEASGLRSMPKKRENIARLQQELPESQARFLDAAVARNANGQSLDDAREAFRAEWEAQLDRKRKQAGVAADVSFVFTQLLGVLVITGAVRGGFLGYLAHFGLTITATLAFSGALLGFSFSLTTAVVARRSTRRYRECAERLERELRERERSSLRTPGSG